MTTRYLQRQRGGSRLVRFSIWLLAITLICCFSPLLQAQDSVPAERLSLSGVSASQASTQTERSSTTHMNSGAGKSTEDTWVRRWLRMVDKTRTEQPHYVAPLVTTHVLLVQQFRFDSSWQTNSNSQTDNYDPLSDARSGERRGTVRRPEYVWRQPADQRCSSSGALIRLEHGVPVQHQKQVLADD